MSEEKEPQSIMGAFADLEAQRRGDIWKEIPDDADPEARYRAFREAIGLPPSSPRHQTHCQFCGEKNQPNTCASEEAAGVCGWRAQLRNGMSLARGEALRRGYTRAEWAAVTLRSEYSAMVSGFGGGLELLLHRHGLAGNVVDMARLLLDVEHVGNPQAIEEARGLLLAALHEYDMADPRTEPTP